MAANLGPVSDGALLRILDEEIAQGISFENDDEKDRRERALEYYDGTMRDLPNEEGRSSVVARIVAEQIDRMLPGLLRVFDGSERVVVYAPMRPTDEEAAEQATDYVNYVWANECDGFLVLSTAIQDALQVRNGLIKVYWDPERDFQTERMTGLSDEDLTLLLAREPDLEIAAHSEYPQTLHDPVTSQPIQILLHDIDVRRVVTNGRLRIENVPPEDFGISARGKAIDTAPWVWHRTRQTRSDLIKQGYPRDIVEELPAYSGRPYERVERGAGDKERVDLSEGEGAMQEVEVIEAYGFVDRDGDGIAESRKVVVAGGQGGREILSDEEWSDERPFIDLKPHVVPHRWMGRSVSDQTMDLQRIGTVLQRGFLDNLYAQNNPQWEVLESAIVSPDEVRERRFNGLVRVKQPGAINPIAVPDISSVTLQGLAAVQNVVERRTGVSQATPSLDETALQPQTATAAQLEHDGGYARVEMIARNMAHLGLRDLFRKVLKIIVANQDRERTIRLRDKWVTFDPRAWDAGMDVSINLGLGTGSRERDMAMLGNVYARQNEIFRAFGPNNPVVSVEAIVGTLHKMVEASGLRNPEQFFAMPTKEQVQAYMASKPPPMDPRIAAIQARSQADQQRFELQAQIAQQKLQMDQQSRVAKVQTDAQADQAEAQVDLQTQRERMEMEAAMQMEKLRQEFELRMHELQMEAELKREALHAGLHAGISTNLARVN
jgi:hypothetical protein